MRLSELAGSPEARSLWRVSKIYWLCLAIIGTWVLLRFAGVDGPARVQAGWFLGVWVLATVNLGLRSLASLQRGRDPRYGSRIGWIFTLADLLLVAAGLRLTGGLHSPLWIVLFVVVVAETILAPSVEARLIYGGAGLALILGTWSPSLAPVPYLFDIGTRLFFLVVVSLITQRLRQNAADKEAELANLRAELAAAGERSRLSRDIHDGVGNALAAAVLRLEVAARVTAKQPETVASVLTEEAQALREAMTAVRDWTFFTRPWSTDDRVSEVLLRETARLTQRTDLPVTVEGAPVLDDLPEAARVAALRITQEALTNAAKYAQATRAEVVVRREGRFVCLSIADKGCGFEAASLGGGIGMSSMRERAESLGGTLRVETAPGCGTTIIAHLPAA